MRICRRKYNHQKGISFPFLRTLHPSYSIYHVRLKASKHKQDTTRKYKPNRHTATMQLVQTLVQHAPTGPKDYVGALGDSPTTQEAAPPTMSEFLQALPSRHLEPLWSRMGAMVPHSPNPVAKPYMWKYKDTLPYLSTAGEIVPEEMAERRVLMLVNPNMGMSSATVRKTNVLSF